MRKNQCTKKAGLIQALTSLSAPSLKQVVILSSVCTVNETNPKGNCTEKPCVTGVLTKRKSTIVLIRRYLRLSCFFVMGVQKRTV